MGPFTFDPVEVWSALNAVAALVLQHVPGPIVEIGCGYGDIHADRRKSTNILAERARWANVKFYTCDIKLHTKIDYEGHTHFAGPASKFMEVFDDEPSVVFLDGCHDYDVVIDEVKFFLNRLKIGGVILMHDTDPKREKSLARGSCSDSYRVRQELEEKRAEMNIDCFTWPYTAGRVGLTMIIKKEPNRPYFRR